MNVPTIALQCRSNPAALRSEPYDAVEHAILNQNALHQAKNSIVRWPGYAPTPLIALPELAKALGIGALYYKDEGPRFGLESFKALGGAYAVQQVLNAHITAQTGDAALDCAALESGDCRTFTEQVTVCCATDGNHGRSVAWGAQRFGCRCVIYLHEAVSLGREQAIARYGAEIVRTPGRYDDAVHQAALDAEQLGYIVVSDTSYEGYTTIPRNVMQGYQLMVEEAVEQLNPVSPTHVLVPGGVGGVAAAVAAWFREHWGAHRPHCAVVEPECADCLYQSVQQGCAAHASGDLDTLMAGLACGETSLLAWQILHRGADAFLLVNDRAAMDCMRLLAASTPPIVAGESAVAGLAGLIGARQHPENPLALNTDSCVLLFGTEGATDPECYQHIVGHEADAVRAGAAQCP